MLHELLHPHFRRAVEHTVDADEHAAVVELLVMAVFSDNTVNQDELDALEDFDSEHSDWDDGAFSVQQYLGPAIAKVRAALDSPDHTDTFIVDAVSRIVTGPLRAEAVGYCAALVEIDGITEGEQAFLDRVTKLLGTAS